MYCLFFCIPYSVTFRCMKLDTCLLCKCNQRIEEIYSIVALVERKNITRGLTSKAIKKVFFFITARI